MSHINYCNVVYNVTDICTNGNHRDTSVDLNIFLISAFDSDESGINRFISVFVSWLGGLHCELDISRLDTSCCLHQTRNQTQLRPLL